MLQTKDIKNLSELNLTFSNRQEKSEFFLKIISILKLGKLQSIFSSVKQKGIPSINLIRLLITFAFIDQKSVHGFTKSYWQQFVGFGKDAYYRLKNNPKIKWRNFLFGVVQLMLKTIEERNPHEDKQRSNPTAFIFDDTVIPKSGKAIEGVSRIWDHVNHSSVLGFQLLVMGYYDGTIFIPINFSIHRSKGKNKKLLFGLKLKHFRKQHSKVRLKNTAGYKRKKELDESKIKLAIQMIKSAVKQNIRADYVLTDSWFTCLELIKTTIAFEMNYIGMFSKVKTLFTYRGKKYTFRKIQRLNQRNIKRNRRFGLYYIRTVVEWDGIQVVLLFTRRGKNGKWKCLISTDLSLSVNKIFEIYQIRWTIEVFFKECKQNLGLGKSQSNDFDAQIADTTITIVQYLFLALQNSIEKYETIGQLFKGTKENVIELRLHERIVALLIAVVEIIMSLFDENSDEEVIILKAINNEETLARLLRLVDIQDDKYKNVA